MAKGIFNIKEQTILRKELRNNSTSAEAVLWKRLKAKQVEGLKFRRQYGVGAYVVDFYCPELRLAIELDGGVHEAAMAYERDAIRARCIEQSNIKIIRFHNEAVFNNMEGVVGEIVEVARSLRLFRPPLAPPNLGGEEV